MTKDEETRQFYHALGLAISRWQQVEVSLGQIFCCLLIGPARSGDATKPKAANAAYYAALNFNVKLAMTHFAFQMHSGRMPKALRDEWKSLHNRIGKRAKERNELVHFIVGQISPPKKGFRIFLFPNFLDPASPIKHKGKDIAYNYEEITRRGASFDALAKDLNGFLRSLGFWGPPAQPTASP